MNRLYGGAYLHADDIRTLSTSATTLQEQITHFARTTSKCEIVSFAQKNNVPHPVCEIENTTLPSALPNAKWHHLSAKPSIDYNILKARKSFFAYGSMGLFQGQLSPVSGKSVVDTCILPVLLYGAENWCLTPNPIKMLNSFLGELSKRLLRLPPQWYCNTPASIVVRLRSARAL